MEPDPARRAELKELLAPFRLMPEAPSELRRVAFISHSTQDNPAVVHDVDSALGALGLNPFVAHRDIMPSKAWRDEIKRRLQRCSVFLALLTDNYRQSEWCDQEAGFIVSRSDVVVVPVSISIRSYGFLSDYQELRWDSGEFVRHNENEMKLAKCLIDRGATDRLTLIDGIRSARNFRAVDLDVQILSEDTRVRPLTITETRRLAENAVANDQIYRNDSARGVIPSFLRGHQSEISAATIQALRAHGFEM